MDESSQITFDFCHPHDSYFSSNWVFMTFSMFVLVDSSCEMEKENVKTEIRRLAQNRQAR